MNDLDKTVQCHVLLSGDLYQLYQHEESSKVLSSHGVSLNDTKNSVGVMAPLKDKHFVKIVDTERIIEFDVSPVIGNKIIQICENDLNDVKNKAEIDLFGHTAQEVFRHIPDRVRKKMDVSSGNLGFASLAVDDSPRLWYALLPERKKASDLYQMSLVAEKNKREVKKLDEKIKHSPELLKHIELADGEDTELLLKFIEGKKYAGGKSDFFISEGKSVVVHDSLASIISFNKKFIEAVYSFLPGETKKNLPDALKAESVFIYPARNGISLDIAANGSYLINLKGTAEKDLMNFLSKYGYVNPLRFEI